MDRIIALFADHAVATRVRTHLAAEGFPADRVELTALIEPGRAGTGPNEDLESNLIAYYSTVFGDDTDIAVVERLVDTVRSGGVTVVVHPRGQVEIELAREVLEAHQPETVFWRVAPAEAQGGLLGERAAGTRL